MSEPIPSPRRPDFRLYVDEVGHATIKPQMTEEERYLSLIGVACELRRVHEIIKPQMTELKERYFRRPLPTGIFPDPDEPRKPIIFHRREMAQRLYPFDVLKDPERNVDFDTELLNYLQSWQYAVFSVVVDKQEIENQRQREQPGLHPYHLALEHLLEGYVHWLERHEGVGDVLAEARGGKEDRLLAQHFSDVYNSGTTRISAQRFAVCLTSKQLKLKEKEKDLAGLQLAEVLAQPCHKSALAEREGKVMSANFNGRIVEVLQYGKYYACQETGRLGTFGKKWLP